MFDEAAMSFDPYATFLETKLDDVALLNHLKLRSSPRPME
jgi:hypothetical protein